MYSQETYTKLVSALCSTAAANELAGADDQLGVQLGTDNDVVLVLRSSTLAANTALTGVLVGTPVTPAVAANSLIVSNVTADGDILIAAQTGGNSQAWIFVDASAGTLNLYGAGTATVIISATAVEVEDGILFALGNDQDVVMLNRASALAANTALTGVLIGTPVTPAVAANSLILANATASGDLLIAGNLGGNSRGYVFIDVSADTMDLMTAGVSRLLFGAAGALWINDTSNADITIGLTINQGANDDGILALKSSDVAHGFTALAETDTYLDVRKQTAADGGCRLTAIADGTATQALNLRGIITAAADTTHSTAGRGIVEVYGTLGSGTDVANATADANILAVRTRAAGADVTRFMLDTDGDSHQDVGTAWTNFDNHDDLTLLNSLAHQVARPGNPVAAAFGGWLNANRGELERLKLVSFNDGPGQDGRPFVNMSKLTMLLVGAVRQLGAQVADAVQQLTETRRLLAARPNP